MPQVSTNTVGSVRQTKEGKFELLTPEGKNVFTGGSAAEAQEFAQSIQLPVREGVIPFTPPVPLPTVPPGGSGTLPGASGGQTGTGIPSGTSGAPQGGFTIQDIAEGKAALPTPQDFTNLLKKVVDTKIGRRPFIIGIPDKDLELLTPSGVRAELSRRTNELLRQGADVQSTMQAFQNTFGTEMGRINKRVDTYLEDLKNRQEMLTKMAFTEPFLTRGVMPESVKKLLSSEEQDAWNQLSVFYKAKFAKGELPELIAKDIDSATGETQLIFRDSITGQITRQTMPATRSPDRQIVLDLIDEYDDAGIMPTDTLVQAQAKLSKSRIYQDKVRAPVGKSVSTDEEKEEKEITQFRNDAAELLLKLDSNEISWASAFDNLRTKYPKATNETINSILGGGIPYDEKTGVFDTSKAYGRAKKK